MAQAVNRDIFYTTTANEYRYRIECEGMVIYEGKAYSKPNSDTISINISKICRDYLTNDLPVIETENTTYTHEDALKRFVLYHYNEASDVWTAVETYDFLWYYDFTNSIPSVLSDPVNGRSVIGARCLKTTYDGNSVVTSIITSDVEVGCQKEDYSGEYLTFEIQSDGYINLLASNNDNRKQINFRKNGDTWLTTFFSGTPNTIQVSRGDIVEFNGVSSTYGSSSWYNSFSGTTCQFKLRGNIMSLVDPYTFANNKTLESAYTFSYLFAGCTGLTDASKLVLPATTLIRNCYYGMFRGCTSLTTPPQLPATTLASNCYYQMFYNCTSLTTPPQLPATTLAFGCYTRMFADCRSLTQAPQLPATTLTDICYNSMFAGCSSLTTAPELPATALADSCYMSMFEDCTNLTTAPQLPATTLADSCYLQMFEGCTNLIQAPALPATTLTYSCYTNMFNGCTSLTTAPELPATTLTERCYLDMFIGCTSLNYIKCLATDISANNCIVSWVAGVASTGTFVKAASMNDWPEGINGIPNNWTVTNGTASQYLYTNNSVSSSNTNVTTSSNTNVSNINGYVVCKCGDYALYYLNRRGGWDTFVFEGNNKRTDTYDIYKYSKVYDNNGIGFGSMRYHNNVTERYELNTGWLTEDEAMRFAKHLCSTNNAYLHVLSEDRILPVVITDTQVEYKKYITDNGTPQPINYTIQVESSQKREIR